MKDLCSEEFIRKCQKHDEHKKQCYMVCCLMSDMWSGNGDVCHADGHVCYYVTVVGPKIDQLVDFYRLTMGPLH